MQLKPLRAMAQSKADIYPSNGSYGATLGVRMAMIQFHNVGGMHK
jgi:hypothetical protein